MSWDENFLALFERCVAQYRSGDSDFNGYYTAADLEFLASIGCQIREFFDFVEDYCGEGEPSPATALLVAAVRRDYFLTVQKKVLSENVVDSNQLPSFGTEMGGIAYLPRIIVKGRAKLRGELDPDLMFGCGGDRNFLRKNGNIHPADFLRHLWAAGDDSAKFLAWIKQCDS